MLNAPKHQCHLYYYYLYYAYTKAAFIVVTAFRMAHKRWRKTNFHCHPTVLVGSQPFIGMLRLIDMLCYSFFLFFCSLFSLSSSCRDVGVIKTKHPALIRYETRFRHMVIRLENIQNRNRRQICRLVGLFMNMNGCGKHEHEVTIVFRDRFVNTSAK